MKIKTAQISSFLKDPEPARAVLFFGPDASVSKQHQKVLASHKGLQYEDITVETFSADPDSLLQHVRTKPLFGDQPLFRLRSITDRQGAKLKKIIDSLEPGDFFVVEAGDLSPRSKIRQLFEADDYLAAIGCYARSPRDIMRLIQDHLSPQGYICDSDALTFLCAYLHKAPHMLESDLEKLITFKGADKSISIKDAKECCPEDMPASFEQVGHAILAQQPKMLADALEGALEPNNAIVFYRHLTREFLRLLDLQHIVASGTPLESAMSQLRPPIFWSDKDRMKVAFNKWPEQKIGAALKALHQGEIDVKKATIAPESLCRGVLQALVTL